MRTEETDALIHLVDDLLVARIARVRAEHHVTVLRELESQAAEKLQRQREKMTVVPTAGAHDATMPKCRV
jgi:hypothetical protein